MNPLLGPIKAYEWWTDWCPENGEEKRGRRNEQRVCAMLDLLMSKYCLCSRSLQPYICYRRLQQCYVLEIWSCCCVVLPIIVVNIYTPRYALEAHSSPNKVSKPIPYCVPGSIVHTSKSLHSVPGYKPGNRCTDTPSVWFYNHGQTIIVSSRIL